MNRKCSATYSLFIIFSFFFLLISEFLYADKIEIKKEDGVTVVYNPRKPDPPSGVSTKLILEEDLTIGAKEGKEEYMFLRATQLEVDDQENIYVLDRKASRIKVYDKNGKFLRAIGKRGQGPGEFQGPRDFYITPQNELLVNDMSTRRLLFFNLDGQFLREASAGKMWLFIDPKADSKENIIGGYMVLDERPSFQLKKFNPNLEPVEDIATLELAKPPVIDPRFPRIHWDVMEGDRIIWGVQSQYVFHILDGEGKLIRKIVKDYDPVDFTKEDKESVLGEQPPPSDVKYEWPKHQLAFQSFSCDDRGWIFVQTYEKKEGQEKGNYYDIFDSEGRYVAKVLIGIRPRVWKKGKMYGFLEDEEGYRFVKRYAVEWK